MYFSRSRSCTPEETPTTRMANFMYFDQAALISSAMMRRNTLSIGLVNNHITANDTKAATTKVAKSKKRNIVNHLRADRSNGFANENVAGTLYYKGFLVCFLVPGIKLEPSGLRDSFVR